MDEQNASVTPSDTPSTVEPTAQLGEAKETILETKKNIDTLRSEALTDVQKKKDSNEVERQSVSASIITDTPKEPTRDEPLDTGKASNDDKNILESESSLDRDFTSNRIVKIETTYPNKSSDDIARPEESCKDSVNNSQEEKNNIPEKQIITVEINERTDITTTVMQSDNQSGVLKIHDNVSAANTEGNFDNEQDEKMIKLELEINCDSMHEDPAEEIPADRSNIIVTKETAEQSSNVIERDETLDRTTEIVELNIAECKNEDINNESVTENTKVIETVVKPSDEGNDNCTKTIELKTTTSEVTKDKALVTNESNDASTERKNIDENSTVEVTKCTDNKVEKRPIEEKPAETEETTENGECIRPNVEISTILSDASIERANDSTSSPTTGSPSNNSKQRSVIEDIFDDWQDENPEEDSSQQQMSKTQDSVEMELKILLDDEKSMDVPCNDRFEGKDSNVITDKTAVDERLNDASSTALLVANDRTTIGEALKLSGFEHLPKESEKHRKETLSVDETKGRVESRKPEKSNESTIGRERLTKQKPLAPRPGVKVPGILLTSPIVSKSAVSKVLKERIREQQKEFDSPTKPDIFFVKKITQRLSHKLAAASAAQLPGLVPIPQIGKSTVTCGPKKTASGVDKELLAILEGDVDPDWSNLKPPSLVEERIKCTSTVTLERNNSPKLDPLTERELALKQLLELPSSPPKKITTKKTPVKPSRNKTSKATDVKATIPPNSVKTEIDGESSKPEFSTIESTIKDDDSMDSSHSLQDNKVDETRSGRKRKPTEKAREHENSTKRLKVFKGKTTANKRNDQEDDHSTATNNSTFDKNNTIDTGPTEITEDNQEKQKILKTTEAAKKHINDPVTEDSEDSSGGKTSREFVGKKVSVKPNAKRKVIREKISPKKKSSLGLKGKFSKGVGKKSGTKLTSNKGQKQRNGETSSAEAKPKKKTINEIDRLLQDEGVVNLLYDVEQPDKKRLVPITKSQTKVMDMQKIQRELKIRTKLVRNAVLRLRTSNITTNKVSPRSKRSISHSNDLYTEKRTNENKIGQSMSPTDFIFPAKIRNAADASIIIRRHSSSSFSSASASPRASIDTPERLSVDGGKYDDNGGASHGLRSNKRRLSQDDEKKKKKQSPEPKRNRRRMTDRSESESSKYIEDEVLSVSNVVAKSKSAGLTSMTGGMAVPGIPGSPPVKSKKLDAKKNPKSSKHHQQVEVIDVDENSAGSAGKIATRSAGGTGGGGKVMPKSKKSVKCKVTFAKRNEFVDKKMVSPGQQDELSACLAEAVTALSNDSGGPSRSRSTIPVNRNKTKGNPSSAAKTIDIDEKKSKTEPRVQFSNNEINVQRHGKLVQLLLTPSTSMKIRNGITLQVMQEIREILSILKKDEDCRVVLLTSTGSSFCEGLELSTLLHENKEERRLRAEELANAVKEFIKSLATFNKPIVAGVQGTAIGLGVTMLPWFDLVIASDKATFSTPYGKLGQIAEGAAIFTLSHILGSAVTSELLLGGRTLTANEALRAGLVTRVLWPDRFQAELLPSLRAMSEQSSQSMEATKALLRHSLRKKLDAALESECYLLIQHWCSAECQAAITAYVDEKIQ